MSNEKTGEDCLGCWIPILINQDPNKLPIGYFQGGIVKFDPPVKVSDIYKIFGNVGFLGEKFDSRPGTFSEIKIISWSTSK